MTKCPFCHDAVAETEEHAALYGGVKAHTRCINDAARPFNGPTVERNFRERVSFTDTGKASDSASAELKSVQRDLRE
jgi:hypothetical protein